MWIKKTGSAWKSVEDIIDFFCNWFIVIFWLKHCKGLLKLSTVISVYHATIINVMVEFHNWSRIVVCQTTNRPTFSLREHSWESQLCSQLGTPRQWQKSVYLWHFCFLLLRRSPPNHWTGLTSNPNPDINQSHISQVSKTSHSAQCSEIVTDKAKQWSDLVPIIMIYQILLLMCFMNPSLGCCLLWCLSLILKMFRFYKFICLNLCCASRIELKTTKT